MKNLLLLSLFFIRLHLGYSQTCSQCEIPSANWPVSQCEYYENLAFQDDLITQHWKVYPNVPNQNYYPVSAKMEIFGIGGLLLPHFNYAGTPVDNYYKFDILPNDYRYQFRLYVFQGKKVKIVLKNSSLGDVLLLYFQGNGTADILTSNNVKISSFYYNNIDNWVSMSLFFHVGTGTMEVFRNNYKVANIPNLPTAANTFPSAINFFADQSGDRFYLDGTCLLAHKILFTQCTLDYHPQCLNGTDEGVGSNGCFAGLAGYFSKEIHDCDKSNNDPCLDCDECFSYFFDCNDRQILHLTNNYCDEDVPINPKESMPVTEYEWEFKNSNNVIVQPEFLNSTSSNSFEPLCRFILPGRYTICLYVYGNAVTGRFLKYTCCYTVIIGLPCNRTPTLFINSGTLNGNNEMTLTTTTTDADSYSWRVEDPAGVISGQSTSASTFKCKIPNGRNCMVVCLTVGNGCGMISKCITICKNNSGCGSKPPSHPPILYQINQDSEVSFTNIPQMDRYEWVLPAGCTFVGGTNSTSRNPTCKLPVPGCSYIVCLKMWFGSCFVCCYCFTIAPAPVSNITFDPDEMACVPTNIGIKVPVRVRGFTNITAVDLRFVLNPALVANFVGVQPGPNVNANEVIDNILSTNKIQVGYAPAGLKTLVDNDILFYLLLETKGPANSTATITIESNTAEVEQNRIIVTPTLKTGTICISGAFKLCGIITREDGKGVKDVTVELSGYSSQSTITDAQGNYCFNNVPGGNYTIAPKKIINPGNGVGIPDISAIKSHNLGINSLSGPYKIIAADVDNNKRIDATDIARIIPTWKDPSRVFINVNSWKFVPKSFQFANPNNPLQTIYPELISLPISADVLNLDFIGIKMGDVNLSNDPQKLEKGNEVGVLSPSLNKRNFGAIELKINSDTVRPNAILKLPVYAKGFKNILAFGFSISFMESKLEFQKMSGFNSNIGISQSDFNIERAANGTLSVSWNTTDLNGVSNPDAVPLFYIEFKVKAVHNEKTTISITNTPTPISFADPLESLNVTVIPGTILVDQSVVAISDLGNMNKEIELYPNPTTGDIYLHSLPSTLNIKDIKIYNIHGLECPFSFDSEIQKLYVTNLKPGIYFIELSVNGTKSRHKIIKV
ncbi:MAG: T9SS type A sorting domain-containing protein [Saprospiraceae bacterium]|nr:T9SS type A sorting domain-containing protein [Saprospiraceae bacterium]